ncbi:MAG: hypothetical protein LQ351_000676 [Letrouitia transgressa]|nr:MAG: hypothetical protein LQ351_000676 [Letrouitia transgressa]
MDPSNYHRLQSALRPKSLALSFLASFWTMLSLQMVKLKGLSKINFGQETKKSDSIESTEEQFKRLFSKPSRDRQDSMPDKLDDRGVSSSEETSNPENSSVRRRLPNDSSHPPLNSTSTSTSTPTSTSGVVGDLSIATDAFMRTLEKTWEPAHPTIVKGSVIFSGLVEVAGPKGIVMVDVLASYHPVKDVLVLLQTSIRRIREKSQSPKG